MSNANSWAQLKSNQSLPRPQPKFHVMCMTSFCLCSNFGRWLVTVNYNSVYLHTSQSRTRWHTSVYRGERVLLSLKPLNDRSSPPVSLPVQPPVSSLANVQLLPSTPITPRERCIEHSQSGARGYQRSIRWHACPWAKGGGWRFTLRHNRVRS